MRFQIIYTLADLYFINILCLQYETVNIKQMTKVDAETIEKFGSPKMTKMAKCIIENHAIAMEELNELIGVSFKNVLNGT